MMNEMTIEVVSTEGVLFNADTPLVRMTTPTGEISIVQDHSPMMVLLDSGQLEVYSQGDTAELFDKISGFAEVTEKAIKVLCTNPDQIVRSTTEVKANLL